MIRNLKRTSFCLLSMFFSRIDRCPLAAKLLDLHIHNQITYLYQLLLVQADPGALQLKV